MANVYHAYSQSVSQEIQRSPDEKSVSNVTFKNYTFKGDFWSFSLMFTFVFTYVFDVLESERHHCKDTKTDRGRWRKWRIWPVGLANSQVHWSKVVRWVKFYLVMKYFTFLTLQWNNFTRLAVIVCLAPKILNLRAIFNFPFFDAYTCVFVFFDFQNWMALENSKEHLGFLSGCFYSWVCCTCSFVRWVSLVVPSVFLAEKLPVKLSAPMWFCLIQWRAWWLEY